MDNKRSYLDTLNAGRQRRSQASLDELTRTLAELESRFDRSQGRATPHGGHYELDEDDAREPAAAAYRQPTMPAGHDRAPWRAPRPRPEPEARGVDAERIAAEMKALRDELRQQITTGLTREFQTLRSDFARGTQNSAQGDNQSRELERLSGVVESLADKDDSRALQLLRLEIQEMKGDLGRLAREDSVRSVEKRWDTFENRFAAFEDRSQPREVLQLLAEKLDDIGEAVERLPQAMSLKPLDESMRTLASAVDHATRAQTAGAEQTLHSLQSRLDEITRAIAVTGTKQAVPLEQSLAPLESRLDDMARAIAAQASKPTTPIEQSLAPLESRLDDITRALAASYSGKTAAAVDDQALQRIEARIALLGRQLEDLAMTREGGDVADHVSLLSDRIGDLAARRDLVEPAFGALSSQVAAIAARLDLAPNAIDTSAVLQGMDRQFSLLSESLTEQLREAEEAEHDRLVEAMEARIAALSLRLERTQSLDADAIRNIETRIEAIAERLDSSVALRGKAENAALEGLETQIAGLAQQMSRPAKAPSLPYDLEPRLDRIETALGENRDTVIEAARLAAESAVLSFSGSKGEQETVTALAADLKSLEQLARRSDHRNTRTFEAIHETLLKVVDRLGTMETAPRSGGAKIAVEYPPSLDPAPALYAFDAHEPQLQSQPAFQPTGPRSPAEAAAAAALAALSTPDEAPKSQPARKSSLLGGIARAFSGVKAEKREPVLAGDGLSGAPAAFAEASLDTPLDPKFANRPLEPGSGAPDVNAIMRRVRSERGEAAPQAQNKETAKSDFIAAARRAAQAAAAEAEILKKGDGTKPPKSKFRFGGIGKARKPLLMAVGAIMIALAGLQLGTALIADRKAAAPRDMSTAAPPVAPVAADVSVGAAETMPAAREAVATLPDMQPKAPDIEASAPEATGNMPSASDAVATAAIPALPEDAATMAGDSAAAAPAAPTTTTIAFADIPVEAGPESLRQAAATGDAKADFEIGARYDEGRGLKADKAVAATWYERSAELGFAPAQYRIGNYYEKGTGVAADLKKAKTWYQLAANQGNASAMHNLAVLFAMGADGAPDHDSAGRWFREAADLGVRDSQFNMGILAAKGAGMPQSLEESYKWFALVAKQGDKDAAGKRDEVANAMKPEQLERARADTELWKAREPKPDSNIVEIPDAWTDKADQTASIDMGKAVRNIQTILNKNGYQAGTPDGMMGAKTKTAIAAFQTDNAMDPTGEVDQKLVEALLAKK